MNKNTILYAVCGVLILAIIIVGIYGLTLKTSSGSRYDDGVSNIDANTIKLNDSKVKVTFSDVILGKHQETRKLIVDTQEASVSSTFTNSLIDGWDYSFLTKTQEVNYKGTGRFVVDLDNLSEYRIREDSANKTITILIDHAYLEDIEVNPDDITIGDVEEGFLNRGDIEITLKDYNELEKDIRQRMQTKFNTTANKNQADRMALQMVKDIYTPLVQAVDGRYEVLVDFMD